MPPLDSVRKLSAERLPVKDNLNPEWFEGIRGVLPLHDEATEVVIEVWDDDGGGGRDDLLGEARLTSASSYTRMRTRWPLCSLAAKPGQPASAGVNRGPLRSEVEMRL